MNKQFLKYGDTFCAVEHATNNDFYLLQLKKKQKELVISKQETFSSQETLLDGLTNQKHIFLIVNNEQVLSKSIDFVNSSKERVVKTAFPNIALQDFYYQVTQDSTRSHVAICRKEILDKSMGMYTDKKISVINFSLGNLSATSLLPFIDTKTISTTNAEIIIENNEIISITKETQKEQSYQINGLEIHNGSTLALSGVLSYYFENNNEDKTAFQQKLEKEYEQNRFFTIGMKFSLGFLFIALLINFLFFSSYRTKAGNLESELLLNETYKTQLVRLNDVVSKKKKLVQSITSASNSKAIWYVDQIAKTTPNTLLLNQINYQPLQRAIKEEKQVQFQTNQIIIKGVSRNDSDFTSWIELLQKLDWIEKVSYVNYGKGTTKQTSFDFVIQMKNQQK